MSLQGVEAIKNFKAVSKEYIDLCDKYLAIASAKSYIAVQSVREEVVLNLSTVETVFGSGSTPSEISSEMLNMIIGMTNATQESLSNLKKAYAEAQR